MKKALKKPVRLSRARYVTSKIGKTKAIESKHKLRKYVPTTKRMNQETLNEMLNQYKMVYVKPNIGMFGNGVIRVELAEEGAEMPYSYQSGVRLREFKTFDEMYASLSKNDKKTELFSTERDSSAQIQRKPI